MKPHRARRRFSQNFLHDPRVIRRIVDAVAPAPDEHLVEIGPGLGALTGLLAAGAGRLDLVEIDRDLAARLRERFAGDTRVAMHEADALRFNISTPLLFRLLAQREAIRDMTFMLQEEVVDRLVAAPGSRTYGRLGVNVALWCEAERLLHVGPGAFRPAPRVGSAVVRLRLRERPAVRVDDDHSFERVVASAFAQRRKTLRNSLRELLDADAIAACGIDPGARAETVDLAGFAALANALAARDGRAGQPD